MSYEGHRQQICANGHFFVVDAYASDEAKCPTCGEAAVWVNNVDDTNYDSWGEIPMELLRERCLIRPAQVKVCNLGHKHQEPEVFRIPTEEERQQMRHYRPHWGAPPVPLPKDSFRL